MAVTRGSRIGHERALIPNKAGYRVRVFTPTGWHDDVVVRGRDGLHRLDKTKITDVIVWLPR